MDGQERHVGRDPSVTERLEGVRDHSVYGVNAADGARPAIG